MNLIRNNNQQNGRRRGRGGGQGGGGGGVRPAQGGQNYNNRGNDLRQRGNATQLLEKYKALARDFAQQGDRVASEYYLQYADHYFRVLYEIRERQPEHQRGPRPGYDAEDDDADVGNGYNPGYAAANNGAVNGDDGGRDDTDGDDRTRPRFDGDARAARDGDNRTARDLDNRGPRDNDARSTRDNDTRSARDGEARGAPRGGDQRPRRDDFRAEPRRDDRDGFRRDGDGARRDAPPAARRDDRPEAARDFEGPNHDARGESVSEARGDGRRGESRRDGAPRDLRRDWPAADDSPVVVAPVAEPVAYDALPGLPGPATIAEPETVAARAANDAPAAGNPAVETTEPPRRRRGRPRKVDVEAAAAAAAAAAAGSDS